MAEIKSTLHGLRRFKSIAQRSTRTEEEGVRIEEDQGTKWKWGTRRQEEQTKEEEEEEEEEGTKRKGKWKAVTTH